MRLPWGNNRQFIAYFLESLLCNIASDKAAVPGVNRNDLHARDILLPSIDLQAEIVSILSNYDDLIENNRRRIQLLEQSARLLYKEWFVHLRFPGHEDVAVVDGVPEGWDEGTISSFYKTASGGTPSRKKPDFFTGKISWVKTQELKNSFIFETDEKITEEAISRSSAKLFPEKTVLVAMYGATVGQTGILARPAATNQACCALLPSDKRANCLYSFLFLLENKQKLINLSQGAAQNNINQEIIRSFPMIMPPQRTMEHFTDICNPVLSQISTLEQQNQQLAQARDLLLPRLMNGDLTP